MAKSELPSPSELRKLLTYNASTGELLWLPRGDAWWDVRYGNKPAFAADDGRGYRTGTLSKRKLFAHRVIWALVHGEWPAADVDHINGDRSDNRLANLRVVLHVVNTRNQRPRVNNTSGITGVTWDKAKKKWAAQISVYGRNKLIGRFDNIEDAAQARRAAQRKYGFHENHGT